jgi:hypothetical protein
VGKLSQKLTNNNYNRMDLPVYKLVINPEDETGVEFVSLVTNPAIEKDFQYFNKQEFFNDYPKAARFEIQNEEKRIISGAAMIADLPIYRYDETRGEYYVVFDKETIFEIAKKWAKGDKYDAVNIHHDKAVNGLSLFESFIVDRERGIMPPKGYEEVADGSWFLSYIVNDESIWQRVKEGEFKGFSVEGFFDFEETVEDKIANAMMKKLKRVLEQWDGKN